MSCALAAFQWIPQSCPMQDENTDKPSGPHSYRPLPPNELSDDGKPISLAP